MTQQYLVGEVSQILGELQSVATTEPAERDIARLRLEAETTPPATLALVVMRALQVTNRICWDALQRREAAAFVREVALCAELRALGVCAGLLEEDSTDSEVALS